MLSAPTRMAPARFEPLDQRRRRGAPAGVAIDLRAGKRRQAGDVEQIFHRERHAGERRQPFAAGAGVRRAPGRASSARCSVTAVKELSSGSRARMRASVASTMLDALARPPATAAAISAAVLQAKSSAAVSSTEHRRRLALVGQRKLVDQRGVGEEQLQIAACTPGVPGRIDRQRQASARSPRPARRWRRARSRARRVRARALWPVRAVFGLRPFGFARHAPELPKLHLSL